MVRRGGVLLVLALAFVAAAALLPVAAEHEPDHRYYVTGTVTNEAGGSVCGVPVRAADVTVPASDKNRTATTDGNGRYTIQLHLHSSALSSEESDEGHTLRVWLEQTGASADVTATPNGKNPSGWGEQTVDFVVPSTVRSESLCTVDLAVGAGIVAVITALAVVGVRWFLRPRAAGRSTRALTKVPGVGRTRARDLRGAGIRTAEDLAAADPDELAAQTEMTAKQARVLVKRAQEFVGDPER